MFPIYIMLRNSTSVYYSGLGPGSSLEHTETVVGEKPPSGYDVDLPALVPYQNSPDKNKLQFSIDFTD